MSVEENGVKDNISEMIPAYALDILDPFETRLVAEHLQTCPRCQEELRAYRQVVDDLPLAMVEVEPPPHLKTRIIGQARSTRQAPPAVAQANWWENLKERLSFRTPTWGLVSLALILVLGASNLFLWSRLNRIEQTTSTTLASVPLTSSESIPMATGMLVISQDGEHGTLIVDGLPVLDPSQQYQLWLIKDGQRTSGGVFSVDAEGYGSLWIESPRPLVSYQGVGITIEPAGGSPGPTGDRVLGGDL
jgi:anti-sigma-K factor RskA